MSKHYRKTHLEINLINLHKNLTMIQNILSPKSVIPVVKANAYGHGLKDVCKYLIDKGVRYFAVAMIEEALEIREIDSTVDILVMGVVSSADLDTLSKNNLTFTLHNESLYNAVLRYDRPIKFHIKIDTGMNRLGFKSFDKAKEVLINCNKTDLMDVEGVYTHLATADSNHAFAMKQIQRFQTFLEAIPKSELPKMIHLSNSSGALKYEKNINFTTHVRVGISLYGETLEEDIDYLLPTFVLKSQIVEIKRLQKGDKVGYDITYEASEDETIGILPIGYADGVYRHNQGGHIKVSNRTYPIIGRICMDQLFIKIDKFVKINDIVVLMGIGETNIRHIAKRLNTIPHEVLCSVSSRVPRVYKK